MAARVALAALDLPTLDGLAADAYVVFVADDERPLSGLGGLLDWRCTGALSRLLQQGALTGAASEQFLTLSNGALPGARIVLFGLGPLTKMTPDAFGSRANAAAEAILRAGLHRVVVGLPEAPPAAASARIVAEAFARDGLQVTLVGDLAELGRALPGLAR